MPHNFQLAISQLMQCNKIPQAIGLSSDESSGKEDRVRIIMGVVLSGASCKGCNSYISSFHLLLNINSLGKVEKRDR